MLKRMLPILGTTIEKNKKLLLILINITLVILLKNREIFNGIEIYLFNQMMIFL